MTNIVKLLRKQTELFLLHPSYGCLNRTPSKWKKKLWKETHTIWLKKNQFQLPHRDCVSPHTGTNSKSAISYNDDVSCTMKIKTEWMFWGKNNIYILLLFYFSLILEGLHLMQEIRLISEVPTDTGDVPYICVHHH